MMYPPTCAPMYGWMSRFEVIFGNHRTFASTGQTFSDRSWFPVMSTPLKLMVWVVLSKKTFHPKASPTARSGFTKLAKSSPMPRQLTGGV